MGTAMLATLARNQINLLAFTATPTGPAHTLCTLFPDDEERLVEVAEDEGLVLEGPHHALLIEGEDRIGALVDVFRTLYDNSVDVFASTAIASRAGEFGCLLYLRPDDVDRALATLSP